MPILAEGKDSFILSSCNAKSRLDCQERFIRCPLPAAFTAGSTGFRISALKHVVLCEHSFIFFFLQPLSFGGSDETGSSSSRSGGGSSCPFFSSLTLNMRSRFPPEDHRFLLISGRLAAPVLCNEARNRFACTRAHAFAVRGYRLLCSRELFPGHRPASLAQLPSPGDRSYMVNGQVPG
jgi:hypothetical protein